MSRRDRETAVPDRAGARQFQTRLLLIAFGALVLRLAYVWFFKRNSALQGDESWYYLAGRALATGYGFADPFLLIVGKEQPAALHPPFLQVYIAGLTSVFRDHVPAVRYSMAVIGAIGVYVMGRFVRAIAGDRAGLLAAAIMTVYAALLINDGLVFAETPATLMIVGTLWLAYRYLRKPTWGAMAWLGLAIGVLSLTRAEYLLAVPFMLLPLAWVAGKGQALVARFTPFVVGTVVVVVILAPWVVFNKTRFTNPVFVSTNGDSTLLGVSCPASYPGGAIVGLWSLQCAQPNPADGDASAQALAMRRAAVHYIGDHLSQLPVTVLAREGRVWNLYDPIGTARYTEGEGRPFSISMIGVFEYYALLILAAFGFFAMRKRGIPTLPLLLQLVIVAVAVAGFGGAPRVRIEADVALVVMSAIAIDSFLSSNHQIGELVEVGAGAAHPDLE
jgi:4-amino-4-deoxy-L-arabinose transferase-like glycosyltransferase